MNKMIFAWAALSISAAVVMPACASADGQSTEANAQSADELKRKNDFFSCNADSDCIAVPRAACCNNGYKEAVNKHKTRQYADANVCTQPQICPLFLINDTRVAECNTASKKCEMVAVADIACGGFVRNAHQCPADQDCLTGPVVGRHPDVPGVCAPKQCIQTVECVTTGHFDTTLCQCVAN